MNSGSGQQRVKQLSERPSVQDIKDFMIAASKESGVKFTYGWMTNKGKHFTLSVRHVSPTGITCEWHMHAVEAAPVELWFQLTDNTMRVYDAMLLATGENVDAASREDGLNTFNALPIYQASQKTAPISPMTPPAGQKNAPLNLGETFDSLRFDGERVLTTPTEETLKGNLTLVHITNLLQSIGLGQMSGRLRIKRNTIWADIFFQEGSPVHAEGTTKYVFDLHADDVYFCTADIGWVTGHSYLVYGPLCNGATTLMFEGIPTYPDAGRFWKIVEKFKVTAFYTAPTAIRSLIRLGEEWPGKYDLSSLRVLGSVGEPINPEAWMWYHRVIGKERCPIVDTWWQTETGGILISALPGAHVLKPGSASRPFFGVEPVVLRDDGTECSPNEGGKLCIKKPWPGMMRTTWGEHDRFIDTYFAMFKNLYFTGDGCRVDADGDYWLMGRVDDVVNVSGHRIGTAEVESALVSHAKVAEAAVAPMPHDIKGQGLYAFITLKDGVVPSEELKKELVAHVRKEIGPIAAPDKIQFAPGLPKTRSGKIMRRILRKIAENQPDQIGDTTTLADPGVVDSLVKGKQ